MDDGRDRGEAGGVVLAVLTLQGRSNPDALTAQLAGTEGVVAVSHSRDDEYSCLLEDHLSPPGIGGRDICLFERRSRQQRSNPPCRMRLTQNAAYAETVANFPPRRAPMPHAASPSSDTIVGNTVAVLLARVGR